MGDGFVAVIGGGPAGSQAAIWLAKLGIPVVVYETSGVMGGLQRRSPFSNSWVSAVPATTLARDLADAMDRNVRDLAIPILQSEVVAICRSCVGFTIETQDSRSEHSRVLIATGTRPRRSGQENDINVFAGLAAAGNYLGTGRRIAILGGGDAAFEAFQVLSDRGNDCSIFSRSVRARSEFRAAVPVSAVHVGRFVVRDAQVVGDDIAHDFDVAFILHGWEPSLPVLRDIDFERDDHGLIVTDQRGKTTARGVFAAGDVVSGIHPCVSTALGTAVQAAKCIEAELARIR